MFRCGIQPHDKIITVNRKAPRHLDEAISIVKDSNKFLDVVIAREDPDVAPASSTTEQVCKLFLVLDKNATQSYFRFPAATFWVIRSRNSQRRQSGRGTVTYTNLTLQTNREVYLSEVAVS